MIKPGCFGMAIVHSQNKTCARCDATDSCRATASSVLKRIHKRMDVGDLIVHYADIGATVGESQRLINKKDLVTDKVALTSEQEAAASALPTKAEKVARTMMGRGVNIHASLLSGENPFTNFLSIPCEMLLAEGFTKPELKSKLMADNPHWKERTAEGQLSMAFALLNGLGCLTMKNGRYVLKEH